MAAIRRFGYHNHRRPEHSDVLSKGIVADLRKDCPRIDADFQAGVIEAWYNVPIPTARGTAGSGRLADLLIGSPGSGDHKPDSDFRIVFEHKSVITAHRNARNRFADLNEILDFVHRGRPHAILVATILLGTRLRVLNVPDRLAPMNQTTFQNAILPRLSSGDHALWSQFPYAVSENQKSDPAKTLKIFRELQTRPYGRTDIAGYDFVLVVPVAVDNVDPPSVERQNGLAIDVDSDYSRMIDTVCRAYTTRWP